MRPQGMDMTDTTAAAPDAGGPDATGPAIAAPLAAALAARGYSTLTPVQAAVLAPEAAGRDLLVSAETGSGKTVAFALAIAPELLAAEPAPAAEPEAAGDREPADAPDAPRAPPPRALVIAPTRELALQVRREVEWLYAGTGLAVASCVGGMDWRTERRAPDRGPAIVVGTPGRLRDHIERGTLRLSGLRAAVLDEADEMLDLGFEEDLQAILAAAPEGRRTLMFSATVPRAIEALAATYQRDALRLTVQGPARQHADIAYRALSVGARDRENAVFNLLRLMDPRLAIVFAKTRASVAHLTARMANRGLSVVALSGELSQGERTHALQALRDGRARVCIATDVAARGIDLPGLDLVVHFDLPGSPETLLHRSGRTGRAGAKGQAVLIVTPSEVRKAQRILALAKVTAEWGRAPSADEVQAAEDERLMAHEALATPVADEERAMVARLQSFGDEALAAAVLRLWRAGRAAPEELHEAPPPSEAPAPVRERAEFGPSVWYSLSAGHDRRVEARWLLPRLCEAGSITRLAIGAIRVQGEQTFIQVAAAAADRLEAGLGTGMALEDGLVLARLDGEPDLTARPDRHAPRPRREGPLPRPSDRPQGPTRAPRGPRPPRDEGERRPYAPRPARDEAGAGRPRGPRPPRDEGERRPYTPRADRGSATDAPRKPRPAAAGDAPRARAPRRAEPGSPGGAAPPKARWKKDDARASAAERGERPARPKAAAPRKSKAPPPNPADPSQSLRRQPGAPTRGKPGPKRR